MGGLPKKDCSDEHGKVEILTLGKFILERELLIEKSMTTDLVQLFWTFFKVGAFTFGGGYAMLPILQRELLEKKQWITEEDLAGYYAVGQTTPGIIAVNTATFVGYHRSGVGGAIAATLGLILPGVMIIILLARLIVGFSDWPQVRHAMAGIKVAVSVLILEALLKLRKSALTSWPAGLIFLAVFAANLFLPQVSPAILVLLAGGSGALLFRGKGAVK